jgi:glycosyltransferase involved in cell wall biosynthesis
MKILMVCHFVPYPPHGGSLQRTYNLLKEISKKNEVHLLALNQKALLPDNRAIAEAIKGLGHICKSIEIFDIPSDRSKMAWFWLLFANTFWLTPYSVWRFNSKELRAKIKSRILVDHFDLVHFDTIDLAQYRDVVGSTSVALNHHNFESALLKRRGKNRNNLAAKSYFYWQAWKLARYEREMIGKVQVNLVCSEKDRQQLQILQPRGRYELIPNGTDIDYFRPQDSHPAKELIFVGGLNWYPNEDAMIYFCGHVLPIIKKRVPEVVIHIVGQKPPEKLHKMAAGDSSIRLYGFVKDIRDYVPRASVFVVPLRVGGGTRLKILDAFACGKAVVSTTIGCEGIAVTNEQDILIGDSAEEFAQKVIQILEDDALRKKLERNARLLVEQKYSWRAIGQDLENVYESVIK